MGLFDKLFKRPTLLAQNDYFKTLTAYQPVFRTWDGMLYESELVRSAIDARARHISKLKVEVHGAAKPKLQARLKMAPNEFQTWSQFLYRLSTILDMQNTAFIIPILDEFLNTTGYYPVLPSMCEIVQADGEPWLRYRFVNGQTAAIELKRCAIMTKYQYSNDFFGESNKALNNTMSLIDIQNQGITEAITSSATFRFMARANNFAKAEDLAKERKRFSRENLSSDAGSGGILLFPNNYTDIKQIESKPYTVDANQMKQIQTNVYNYFGVNEKVLQNAALGNELDAFYNGGIEPFALQFSEVLTAASFSPKERAQGSSIYATANRLQYMTTSEKVQIAQQLGDRGMILIDEIRELFNYPPLPDGKGQVAPIRGEYYMVGDEKPDEGGGENASE